MILAGDIGGTKTNLALVEREGGRLAIREIRAYPSREFRTLEEVLRVFVRDHPAPLEAAGFGIAGPVVDGRSRLTNLGWDVDGRSVAGELGLPAVSLLNDLGATAYGVLHLRDDERLLLKPGTPEPKGAIAVIAAGTGLGEGGLLWDGRRFVAIPSEGGHTDFGPRDEVETELLRHLTAKFGRVSYERIACGPGLVNVYEFFRARARDPEPEWLARERAGGDPSAAIAKAGMERADPVAAKALELFVSVYGAEAGNLALKILATGGVYVGGGIAPKILRKIQEGEFVRSFVMKGRYEGLMRQMPVWVILNDRIAIIGAAHHAVMDR
jgi:glucokinase